MWAIRMVSQESHRQITGGRPLTCLNHRLNSKVRRLGAKASLRKRLLVAVEDRKRATRLGANATGTENRTEFWVMGPDGSDPHAVTNFNGCCPYYGDMQPLPSP